MLVATFSSVAILVAEEGSSGNIGTAEQAIWWTLTTMTTVGYGDLTPVTTLGRTVAVLTMFSGIGVFGAFTALIASLLVRPRDEYSELRQISQRLEEMEQSIRLLSEVVTRGSSPEERESPPENGSIVREEDMRKPSAKVAAEKFL